MATTTGDDLFSPDDVDDFAGLVTDLATMQQSVQDAFDQRAVKSFKWTNEAERLAESGMSAGDEGYQEDIKVRFFYDGSTWLRGTPTPLQLDTTNSIVQTVSQFGFGKIVGNGTAEISEAVTFPTPFGSVPSVVVNFIGYRTAGAPFNLVGLTAASALTGAGQAPSTTGFTASLRLSGSTLSPTLDWYYSWQATGVPA